MRYTIGKRVDGPDDVWVAEAVHETTGDYYGVVFHGPESERRATEYVGFMNGVLASRELQAAGSQ